MSFLFGAAKQIITPPFPTCLSCSQQKDTLFKRVHDDIFVRSLVLKTNGAAVLIISYDLLFHSRDLYDFICNYTVKYGVTDSSLLVSYTHNHNSPSTLGYNDFSSSLEYETFLKESTISCIDAAFSNLEHGSMEYGIIDGEWSVNRRKKTSEGIKLAPNPEGPVDKRIYTLKLKTKDDIIKCLLINYACHPVHYPDTLAVTSEYPGFLCRYIEDEIPGCTPLFLQGAGADTRPLNTAESGVFKKRSYEHIEKMALSMKDAIIAALQTSCFSAVKPSFSSVFFTLNIPTEEFSKQYFKENIYSDKLSNHLKRNAKNIYDAYDSTAPSFLLACGIIKLADNLLLVHMGGEPCCEIKFAIEKSLTGYNIIFAGYTDACSYIITDAMIDEGGYEADCFIEYMHKGPLKLGIDKIIAAGYAKAIYALNLKLDDFSR